MLSNPQNFEHSNPLENTPKQPCIGTQWWNYMEGMFFSIVHLLKNFQLEGKKMIVTCVGDEDSLDGQIIIILESNRNDH